jgi:hypothetical protein
MVLIEQAASTVSSPNGWWGIGIGLAALGWNVYSAREDRKRKVLVRQVGGDENVAQACGPYKVIYLVRVSITNESPRRPVTIASYGLSLPWKDDDLEPLPDPAELERGSEYVLDGLWAYERKMILNHRVNNQGRLDVAENLEGGLVFKGHEPIPDDVIHGHRVDVKVTVYLQDGTSFSSDCKLRVDTGFERRVIWPEGIDLLAG